MVLLKRLRQVLPRVHTQRIMTLLKADNSDVLIHWDTHEEPQIHRRGSNSRLATVKCRSTGGAGHGTLSYTQGKATMQSSAFSAKSKFENMDPTG